MQFSAKITHSLIVGLKLRGADMESLWELTDVPREFLRDPTCWLEARKVEDLLRRADELFGGDHFIQNLGHKCFELKAWGILDSVLRMLEEPNEIYFNPNRFLSHFISPEPPIQQVIRQRDLIQFEIPISRDEFPMTTEYLRSAMEAIPTFMGKDSAQVTWVGNRVEVNWHQKQAPLFDSETVKMAPDFIQNLIGTLETTEKELQDCKQRLRQRDAELEALKDQVEVNVKPFQRRPGDDVRRLQDYLVRAHQLVTLLVSQGRETPQVREAMRRVNWSQVVEQYPLVVETLLSGQQKPEGGDQFEFRVE